MPKAPLINTLSKLLIYIPSTEILLEVALNTIALNSNPNHNFIALLSESYRIKSNLYSSNYNFEYVKKKEFSQHSKTKTKGKTGTIVMEFSVLMV